MSVSDSASEIVWRDDAPANLALIKYMGKTDVAGNRPSNASLSFTMEHLRTFVEISPLQQMPEDQWESLKGSEVEPLKLSDKGRQRFLAFFAELKSQWSIPGCYLVRSGNNFPSDCGLASSASSFAALTKATYKLALDQSRVRDELEDLTPEDLSRVSRRGSGSSCRSFFAPWSIWRDEGATSFQCPLGMLLHQVIVLTDGKKSVSSSEAHLRVASSELFQGRATRAEHRLQKLTKALNEQNWREIFEVTWADFWDMHALFETSEPAFGYMSAGSMKVLELVREIWRDRGDGPLVTMDAGPNVHLIYRMDQKAMALWVGDELRGMARVIESPWMRKAMI